MSFPIIYYFYHSGNCLGKPNRPANNKRCLPTEVSSLASLKAALCQDNECAGSENSVTLYSAYYDDYTSDSPKARIKIDEELNERPDFAIYFKSIVGLGKKDLFVENYASIIAGPLKAIEWLSRPRLAPTINQTFFRDNVDRLKGLFADFRDFKRDRNAYYRAVMFAIIEQLFFSSNNIGAFEEFASFIETCAEYAMNRDMEASTLALAQKLQAISREVKESFEQDSPLRVSINNFLFCVNTDSSFDKALISAGKTACRRFLSTAANEPIPGHPSRFTYAQALLQSSQGSLSLENYIEAHFSSVDTGLGNDPDPDIDFIRSGFLLTALNAKGTLVDICEERGSGGGGGEGGGGLVCEYYDSTPIHIPKLQLPLDGGGNTRSYGTVHLIRWTGAQHHFGILYPRNRENNGGLGINRDSYFQTLLNGRRQQMNAPLPMHATGVAHAHIEPFPAPLSSQLLQAGVGGACGGSSNSGREEENIEMKDVAHLMSPTGLHSRPRDLRILIKSYFPYVNLHGGMCTYDTRFKNDVYNSNNISLPFDSAVKIVQSTALGPLKIDRNVARTFFGPTSVPGNASRFHGYYSIGDPIWNCLWRYKEEDVLDFDNELHTMDSVLQEMREASAIDEDGSGDGDSVNFKLLTASTEGMRTVWVDIRALELDLVEGSLLSFLVSFDSTVILSKADFILKVLQSHDQFGRVDPTKFTIDDSTNASANIDNRSSPQNKAKTLPTWSKELVDGSVVTFKRSKVTVTVFDGFRSSAGQPSIILEVDLSSSLRELIIQCKAAFNVGVNKRFQLYLADSIDSIENENITIFDIYQAYSKGSASGSASGGASGIDGLTLRSKYCSVIGTYCEDSRELFSRAAECDEINADGSSRKGHTTRQFFFCESCMNTFLSGQRKPRGTLFVQLPKPYPIDPDSGLLCEDYRALTDTVDSLFLTPVAPREEDQNTRFVIPKLLRNDIPCPFRGAPSLLEETWISSTTIYMRDSGVIDYEFDKYRRVKPKARCCLEGIMACDLDYRLSNNILLLGCGHMFHKDCLGLTLKADIEMNQNNTKVPVCPECKNLNDANPEHGICKNFCAFCDGEPTCHRYTKIELQQLLATFFVDPNIPPDANPKVEEYWEKYEKIIFKRGWKTIPLQPGEMFFECSCQNDCAILRTNATDFNCQFCNTLKCTKCKLDVHPGISCFINRVRQQQAIAVGAGMMTRMCGRVLAQCPEVFSIPVACLHSTCTNQECGFEFCYLCGVEYNNYLAHGGAHHYPQCDKYSQCCDKRCCDKEEDALLPPNAGGASGGGVGQSYASHIGSMPGETKARSRCITDPAKYYPGPCDGCFEVVGKHNTCTHHGGQPNPRTGLFCNDPNKCVEGKAAFDKDPLAFGFVDKGGVRGYICRHFCKQCRYLRQPCQPMKMPPDCEIKTQAQYDEEEAKIKAGNKSKQRGAGGSVKNASNAAGGGAP